MMIVYNDYLEKDGLQLASLRIGIVSLPVADPLPSPTALDQALLESQVSNDYLT